MLKTKHIIGALSIAWIATALTNSYILDKISRLLTVYTDGAIKFSGWTFTVAVVLTTLYTAVSLIRDSRKQNRVAQKSKKQLNKESEQATRPISDFLTA